MSNTLTCDSCKNLLNVPPIFSIEHLFENGDTTPIKSTCGRCHHLLPPNSKHVRQEAYENSAQLLSYPCCNKKFGCEKMLNWTEVSDHEKDCNFQSTACPLSFQDLFPEYFCNWTGNVKDLEEHIRSTHEKHIHNSLQYRSDIAIVTYENSQNSLQSRFSTPVNKIFFTYINSQLVTVVIKHESHEKFYCLLMINGNYTDSQCYRYHLQFLDEKNISIVLKKNRLEPLSRMTENVRNIDKILEVDFEKIRETLRDSTRITERFWIVKKSKKEILEIAGITEDHPSLNGFADTLVTKGNVPPDESMLQELECPVCKEYMIPPIYICQNGHSICCDCKLKVNACPICRTESPNARNYTLEKLTTKVRYPCRNRGIGCTFTTTSDKIRSHGQMCELTEMMCFLGCGHECMRRAMYNHVLDRHPNSLLAANVVHSWDVSEKRGFFYVLYVSGELFRFSIKGSNLNTYKFSMEHFGMVKGEPKFCFQLQFVNPSQLGLEFGFTYLCQCLMNDPGKSLNNAKVHPVPWCHVEPFVSPSGYFDYKIVISKISSLS